MALTQPILYTQPAFDADKEYDSKTVASVVLRGRLFQFNVIGGDQIGASKLTVQNAETLETVYPKAENTGIQDSYEYTYLLPAHSLVNGNRYQAVIQTYATTDTQHSAPSTNSAFITFYCYSDPSFAFSNFPTGGVIKNSNYNFLVDYSQLQGEPLNSYTYNLYDDSNILVDTSGRKYNSDTSSSLTISHVFSGFENNKKYYVECIGYTQHGMEITTGRNEINISYDQPASFSYLYLTNNCSEGYVTVKSNVQVLAGTSYPGDPVYIDGKELDLIKDGSYVEWGSGFVLPNDYTIGVWGRSFKPGKEFLQFFNTAGDKVELIYFEENDRAYVQVLVTQSGSDIRYSIYSNEIAAPDDTEQIATWLRCVGGLYEVKIENRGVTA